MKEKYTMSLFGAIVKTAVNISCLPIAIVKDVVTLGGVATDHGSSYTEEQIEKIKREADE
jgi:hypothetical protein